MATNIRKIRDLGSNFSHETAGLLPFFTTISKKPSHTHPDTVTKKRNGFFIVVSTLVATKWLLMLGKFETKARILGMKPKVCCRPLLLSKKSISRPLQEKKAKLRLTFQLLFSKLLFSFFENNVFT